MSDKKKVKYTLGDGAAPSKFGGFLAVKAPMNVSLDREETRKLSLGVSFDTTVVLLESTFVKTGGVTVANRGRTFAAGEEIEVELDTAGADHRVDFDRGQTVALVLPAFDDFDIC